MAIRNNLGRNITRTKSNSHVMRKSPSQERKSSQSKSRSKSAKRVSKSPNSKNKSNKADSRNILAAYHKTEGSKKSKKAKKNTMILQGQGGKEIRKKVTVREIRKSSPSSKSKSSNSRSRSKDRKEKVVPLHNMGVK